MKDTEFLVLTSIHYQTVSFIFKSIALHQLMHCAEDFYQERLIFISKIIKQGYLPFGYHQHMKRVCRVWMMESQ